MSCILSFIIAGNIAVWECPIDYIQAVVGSDRALAFVPAYEAGNSPTGERCNIYIAREQDHGFDQFWVIDHETRHCYGWTHGHDEVFDIPRRKP